MIVRDWENEDTGKVADVLMVWSQGVTVGKKLDKLNAKGKLEARDIILEREGSKMNDTKYDISWAEEGDKAKRPLNDEDKKLLEKQYDLKRYYEPPEYDDFYKPASERGKENGDPGQESLNRRGAFARRDSKDADDDKPARRPATRRTSGTAKPAGLAGFGKKKDEDKKSSPETTVRRRRRS